MISEPQTDAPNGKAKKPVVYQPFDEILRLKLETYCATRKISRKALSLEMGVGETQVHKYLNSKPDWNVADFERRAREVLETAPKRALIKVEIFETSVTRLVSGVIESMRKKNHFGLIYGGAGWGKTCAIELYVAQFATTVFITCAEWDRTSKDMIRLLWSRYGSGRIAHGETRMMTLLKIFKDSNRPVIVDNAQRLTRSGLKFWFDFHDATGCPVIFAGNPEVVDLIKQNDQMFSRLGPGRLVELQEKEYLDVTRQITEQVLGRECPQLEELALDVIRGEGHLRSLKQQLSLAADVVEEKPGTDWKLAFRLAGTQMVRQQHLLAGKVKTVTVAGGTSRTVVTTNVATGRLGRPLQIGDQ